MNGIISVRFGINRARSVRVRDSAIRSLTDRIRLLPSRTEVGLLISSRVTNRG